MEEKIKEIISLYTKVPVNNIGPQTIIDRSAVSSSILVHRMYAHLAKEQFKIDNYWDITTYGALLQKLNGHISQPAALITAPVVKYNAEGLTDAPVMTGIDIEEISSMPVAIDFREDEFYTMNFSAGEIAYCILQPNPAASFAGLFAVKEAIVKADNSYINLPFNTIIITHLPGGKPVHPDFQISISHTSTVAIGIAIKASSSLPATHLSFAPASILGRQKSSFINVISIVAILFSLIALVVCFLRK